MIKIVNGSFNYKNKKLFSNINLEIQKDGLYVIEGENGTGKSTLFNIISKILKIKATEINISNNVSYASQEVFLLDKLNVEENFKFFNPDKVNSCIELLNEIDSTIDVHKIIKKLSGGQQKKVQLVSSLLREADIFLFDEPLNSLDEKSRTLVTNIIKDLSVSNIVLVIDHTDSITSKNNKISIASNLKFKKTGPKSTYKKIKNKRFNLIKLVKQMNNTSKILVSSFFIMSIFGIMYFDLTHSFQTNTNSFINGYKATKTPPTDRPYIEINPFYYREDYISHEDLQVSQKKDTFEVRKIHNFYFDKYKVNVSEQSFVPIIGIYPQAVMENFKGQFTMYSSLGPLIGTWLKDNSNEVAISLYLAEELVDEKKAKNIKELIGSTYTYDDVNYKITYIYAPYGNIETHPVLAYQDGVENPTTNVEYYSTNGEVITYSNMKYFIMYQIILILIITVGWLLIKKVFIQLERVIINISITTNKNIMLFKQILIVLIIIDVVLSIYYVNVPLHKTLTNS